MADRFFEKPILNSPYALPAQHWELDEHGQPTQELVQARRPARFITAIPKPRKVKKREAQQELIANEGKGISTAEQAYDPSPVINELRISVTVERRKETEAVEIIVRDSGRGMSPAEQNRAFEPGYTTKRRGWGLGLALARRVVEEYHGGRLFIRESAPGDGTTIVASFPT